MQSLATVCGRTEELSTILEYIKTIINFTKDKNIPNTDYEITYELPDECFWKTVNDLFENPLFKSQYIAVSKIMGYQFSPIERKHFIVRGSEVYPLSNSSILVDYYNMLMNNSTDEEKEKHYDLTIFSLIENSYNFSPNASNRVLINPILVDKNNVSVELPNKLFFVAMGKGKVLVVVKSDCNEDEGQTKNLIKTIDEYNKNDGLRFVEKRKRKDINGSYGVDINKNYEIIYMFVESFTDVSTHYSNFVSDNDEFKCSLLDLIYFLGFSESFDELIEFIKYDKSEKAVIFSIGGKSNLFFTWKNSNKSISSGAIDYDSMLIDYNESETYVYDFFKDFIYNFPKNNKSLFCDPLNWNYEKADLDYSRIFHKSCHGFGGEIKSITPELTVFFAKNVELFAEDDFSQNFNTCLNTMDELCQRLFLRYSDLISNISILKGKMLQLLYIPWNYAKSKFPSMITNNQIQEVIFGEEYIEDDSVIIRFTYDTEKLLNYIEKSKNRKSENTFLKELLQPLCKYSQAEFKLLEEKLVEDSQLKKTVGVFRLEQSYYFSNMTIDTDISSISYTKARKEIAKVCKSFDINSGEYHGKDANIVIRTMQLSIVKVFEECLSSFDKLDLHNRILNYYSIQQNGVILNYKRYVSFRDLDEQVQVEFEEKTRNIREEYRRNAETAKYLLESNLVIEHKEDSVICSNEDFDYLLAFANWLVVLQDNADICHHTDLDLYVTIDSEYKVDTIFNDDARKQHELMLLRKYNSTDYYIKNDKEDLEFFNKAIEGFNKDTKVDYRLLISLLDYMELRAINDGIANEVYPNVFEINRKALIQSFNNLLEEGLENTDEINSLIEFMTINPSLIKTISGTQHEFLPIWERKKRNNRFEVKPLVAIGDKLIFSPVSLNNLKTLWISGITDWYLPYEIGLSNLKAVLKEWKKRYEDQMVLDIAQIFQNLNFDIVTPNIELMRRFPKEDYPEELGDFDVIAINKERKEIWIVESKVIQKVGSIYENQMQQKSFFFQHEEDEKFQRRIDYMVKYNSKVLSSFGIEKCKYKVVPYMITNKLFMSRYKNIAFPIVSFKEFESILNEMMQSDQNLKC